MKKQRPASKLYSMMVDTDLPSCLTEKLRAELATKMGWVLVQPIVVQIIWPLMEEMSKNDH